MTIDYTVVLSDLEERRAKLTAAIEAIREIMGGASPAGRTSQSTRGPRAGTVASIAYETIRGHGGPMKVAEVVKVLAAGGKFKKAGRRSNYGTVYGTLTADARFLRVGEGEFDIRDRPKEGLTG